MKPSKPCKKCGKHPRLKGSYYCAECKAEIVKELRAKKRAYMKVYTAAKKAVADAVVKEAAEDAAAALTPPQPGQWTTTSITTVTTNGDNPPTVCTETKTEPTRKKRVYTRRGPGALCVRCGKAPKKPGRSYCAECEKKKNREYFRVRYAKEKLEEATGKRTGSFAKPCIRCGNPERVPGKPLCRECYNAELRARKANKRRKLAAPRRLTEKAPIVVQQNNAQNNNVRKFVQPGLPFDAPEKTPIVVQQNNVQNNAPMHDLETVTPKEQTLNVNVTNPIKVDVQHTTEHDPHWWVGYLMAAVFFLVWLGSVIKSWFK